VRIINILFLCTANSCRSILSEAIFNYIASKNMKAFSAGSEPSGIVQAICTASL
jgi:arsenate reductase